MKIYFLFILVFVGVNIKGISQTPRIVIDTTNIKKEVSQKQLPVINDSVIATSLHKDKPRLNDKDKTAIDTFTIVVTPLPSNLDQHEPQVKTNVTLDTKSEITLTLFLKNTSSLDSLYIKYGASPGIGTTLNLKLACMNVDGKYYLVSGNTSYEVKDKKVTLKFPVSNILIAHQNYLWVRGKRKNGVYTSDYIK